MAVFNPSEEGATSAAAPCSGLSFGKDVFIYRFLLHIHPSWQPHSLSGVLGSLRQGRRIHGWGCGRMEEGDSRNTALFCHREGELTAVSPPERLVLKVPFYSSPRRRGRRSASLLFNRRRHV